MPNLDTLTIGILALAIATLTLNTFAGDPANLARQTPTQTHERN